MPSKYLFRLRKAQTRRTRSTAVGTSTCGRDHIGLGQIEPRLDRLGLDIVSRNDFLRHSADYPRRAFDSYRESCSDMSCLGAQIRRRERRAAAIVPTVSSGRQMQQFWDARAREDAYYFVDDRLDYRHPDIERFWAEGEVDLDRVLESVGARIEPSDAVVEIGCGLGRLTRAIAGRARSVTGIDVSEEMLTRARQLNAGVENVAWVHGNGTDLAGIDDASADACVSHVVFQHIPDPNVTLGYVREIGRVLRPGGWAAFQISNDASVHRRRRGVGARLRSIVGRAPRGQENPSWLGSPIDLAELRSVSHASGLDVEDVAGAGTQYCIVLVRRR